MLHVTRHVVILQFEIDHLLPEQENSLRKFLRGENVLVNEPTVYAKSFIFHYLLIAADALLERLLGGSSRRFDRLCRPVTIFMPDVLN